MDARGIELFEFRRVSVRLPDGRANALSDSACRSSSGLVRTRPGDDRLAAGRVVAVVPIASDGNGVGVTTRRTISAKIAAIAATSSRRATI
jgi:hypothetical protein